MDRTTKDDASSLGLVVKMALLAWQSQNRQVDKMLEEMTDQQWMADVAPGRSSGRYLLGHLIAVNDRLFPLLGAGDRLHPELDPLFHDNADKTASEYPSMKDLRGMWKEVNDTLTRRFNEFTPEEWLSRHNSVTPEDFAREPHRNKLNVILTRTTHQGYHIGQLVFLKKK